MTASYYIAFRLRVVPEWTLLFDFTVTLPLIYWWLYRPGLKKMLMRWLSLAMLAIFIGRYIIPEQSKAIFHALEDYRYISLALGAIAEIAVGAFLIYKLTGMLRLSRNADEALKQSIAGLLGQNTYAALALFEARIWYYALFMRKGASLEFSGGRRFGYARNGGNASNQLGFIIAILFELPLMHMLLHFIWSPTAAIVASALSAWALLYMVADYRATLYRPVSLANDAILIRCGVLAADAAIPYSMVQAVHAASGTVRRRAGVRRYIQLGAPNVLIELKPGSSLPDLFGRQQSLEKVYLSLDDPAEFIQEVWKKVFVTVG
ncbi:hypothetical protein ASD15_02600 [Massilia sp. Root351]|nr:hypothetical protein ASD15_02600 [Massilia sp. Root351]